MGQLLSSKSARVSASLSIPSVHISLVELVVGSLVEAGAP